MGPCRSVCPGSRHAYPGAGFLRIPGSNPLLSFGTGSLRFYGADLPVTRIHYICKGGVYPVCLTSPLVDPRSQVSVDLGRRVAAPLESGSPLVLRKRVAVAVPRNPSRICLLYRRQPFEAFFKLGRSFTSRRPCRLQKGYVCVVSWTVTTWEWMWTSLTLQYFTCIRLCNFVSACLTERPTRLEPCNVHTCTTRETWRWGSSPLPLPSTWYMWGD